MNNQYQNQNNQNLQNAQKANQQMNMENSSELARSNGEISRLLLAKSKAGFEFGKMGNYQTQQSNLSNMAATGQQNQLEVDQLSGKEFQILSQTSRNS